MYMFELMAMKVDGVGSYFKEYWNYVDQFTLVFYIAFCIILTKVNSFSHKEEEELSDSQRDLINILKFLKASLLAMSWIKISWY